MLHCSGRAWHPARPSSSSSSSTSSSSGSGSGVAARQLPARSSHRSLSTTPCCRRPCPTAAPQPPLPHARRHDVSARARSRRKPSEDVDGLMDADDMQDDILAAGDRALATDGFGPDVMDDEDEAADDGPADDLDDDDVDDDEVREQRRLRRQRLDVDALLEDVDEAEDALEDAWDQALVNFPSEQDEVDLSASPEEARRTAALRLVRADQVSQGVEVEVEDIPDAPEQEPRTLEQQLAGLTPRDRQLLMTNRQGYLEFEMDGVSLLVAEAADGRLALADAFLYDAGADAYSRAQLGEGVPDAPALYQVVPWEVTQTGDKLKLKKPSVKVLRMYFLPVLHDGSGEQPYQVDLRALYCFFTSSRRLERVPVTPLQDNIQDPVLRIREDGAWVEDTSQSWHWTAVAEGYGAPGVDYSERFAAALEAVDRAPGYRPPPGVEELLAQGPSGGGGAGAGEGEGSALQERLEELELMEELDDVPDVPAVDLV